MRTLTALTLAAPLALLAACGQTTPANEAVAGAIPQSTEVADLDGPSATVAPGSEGLPLIPKDALDSVDYAGTYGRTGDAGSEQLTLNPADSTYEYTAGDGTVKKGSYTRMDDKRRLAIEDFDGKPAYFTVTDGSIFRLDSIDTPADEITVTAQYRRSPAVQPGKPGQGGPEATTNTIADKRGKPATPVN